MTEHRITSEFKEWAEDKDPLNLMKNKPVVGTGIVVSDSTSRITMEGCYQEPLKEEEMTNFDLSTEKLKPNEISEEIQKHGTHFIGGMGAALDEAGLIVAQAQIEKSRAYQHAEIEKQRRGFSQEDIASIQEEINNG